MADNSVDAIVTDPPYGLSFMGKKWDYDVPEQAIWEECLRVLKPGGHLLAFAGTRTQHRMAVRIEDAGFEIRDMIAWVYGSGFPKSHSIGKAIDREAGERGAVGKRFVAAGGDLPSPERNYDDPPLVLEAAKQWQGWGTALKPALEPITMARKPLIGTVAENVLAHGTGALNIDGCRVACDDVLTAPKSDPANRRGVVGTAMQAAGGAERNNAAQAASIAKTMEMGRWPANLIHDGSDEVLAAFPDAPGQQRSTGPEFERNAQVYGKFAGVSEHHPRNDSGSAARFFYCAKASKSDRGESNGHPTVKPTELMRYLVRLVTQPGGTVLDPFCGSGSTGKAAVLEGFGFIGIEREAEYVAIAEARIVEARRSLGLFA